MLPCRRTWRASIGITMIFGLFSHRVINFDQITIHLVKDNKPKVSSMAGHSILPFCINEQYIEGVDQFIYFGSIVFADGGTKLNITRRFQRARSRSWSQRYPVEIASRQYFLWSRSSTWKVATLLLKDSKHSLTPFSVAMVRVLWPDKISNEELRRHTRAKVAADRSRFTKWWQLHCWLCHAMDSTIPEWLMSG